MRAPLKGKGAHFVVRADNGFYYQAENAWVWGAGCATRYASRKEAERVRDKWAPVRGTVEVVA